jgi:hypothetical protein
MSDIRPDDDAERVGADDEPVALDTEGMGQGDSPPAGEPDSEGGEQD